MSDIKPESAAGVMRVLANMIDQDNSPDYVLVMVDEDNNVTTAMHSPNHIIALIGAVDNAKFELNDTLLQMKYDLMNSDDEE